MNPLHVVNDGEAIRLFTTFINDDSQQSNINLYPEQFSIWKLGILDDESGVITSEPKELISGLAVKNKEQTYTLAQLRAELQKLGD